MWVYIFISLKYLSPLMFCVSGSKVYQPVLILHNYDCKIKPQSPEVVIP